MSASARRLFSRSAALFSARVSPVGDLTLSLGGLRVPALVRFFWFYPQLRGTSSARPSEVVLSTLFSSSSRAAAISEVYLRRRKPSCGCAEGRTLILEGEGRCLIWREDAVPFRKGGRWPRRMQSSLAGENAVLRGRRTL